MLSKPAFFVLPFFVCGQPLFLVRIFFSHTLAWGEINWYRYRAGMILEE